MQQNLKYHAPFEAGKFYHVYNRGNNRENIFYDKGNYDYFLALWRKYIDDYTDVFAYCLLPNHFHFLIQVKDEGVFQSNKHHSDTIPLERPTKSSRFSRSGRDINQILEKQFQKFFIAYAKAINKQQNRTGSLFTKRFKRILVKEESYFTFLIHYIHHNPIHHGFAKDHQSWNYSSFNAITAKKQTNIAREKVLNWFNDAVHFLAFHKQNQNYNQIDNLIIE